MITDLPNKYPAFGLDHCLGAYLQPSDTNIEFRTRLQMKKSALSTYNSVKFTCLLFPSYSVYIVL